MDNTAFIVSPRIDFGTPKLFVNKVYDGSIMAPL